MHNYKHEKHTVNEYTLESHTYNSWKQWKNLLVFWAIHWNEICWPEAIKLIIYKIKSWAINLVNWSVTLIPIANPAAYVNNNRQVNIDLWRNFDSKNIEYNYEQKIIEILEKYIKKCDYFLDIHSTLAPTKPCVFEDYPDEKTSNFSQSLWIADILTGWPELYTQNNSPDANMYAHEHSKTWVLIECWSHLDNASKWIWVDAITNALSYLNITNNPQKLKDTSTTSIHMKELFIKEKNWVLSKKWTNLESIFKWDIICIYDDSEEIIAAEDGFIILPKSNAEIWDEWFYFWVKN